MKIDGSAPIKGTPGDRAATSKPVPKGSGKSFGAAFHKAATAHPIGSHPVPAPSPAPSQPASPLAAAPAPAHGAAHEDVPASHQDGPIKSIGVSPEDHMEAIKFRLKTGYYNNKNVDDALTDKLTGFFDELA